MAWQATINNRAANGRQRNREMKAKNQANNKQIGEMGGIIENEMAK
jgi:hypothetical protein